MRRPGILRIRIPVAEAVKGVQGGGAFRTAEEHLSRREKPEVTDMDRDRGKLPGGFPGQFNSLLLLFQRKSGQADVERKSRRLDSLKSRDIQIFLPIRHERLGSVIQIRHES